MNYVVLSASICVFKLTIFAALHRMPARTSDE